VGVAPVTAGSGAVGAAWATREARSHGATRRWVQAGSWATLALLLAALSVGIVFAAPVVVGVGSGAHRKAADVHNVQIKLSMVVVSNHANNLIDGVVSSGVGNAELAIWAVFGFFVEEGRKVRSEANSNVAEILTSLVAADRFTADVTDFRMSVEIVKGGRNVVIKLATNIVDALKLLLGRTLRAAAGRRTDADHCDNCWLVSWLVD
jgi:hypothetical protein